MIAGMKQYCSLCKRTTDRPDDGFKNCPRCRAARRKSQPGTYARLKAAGKCVDCSGPAEPGKVRCAAHLKTKAAKVREIYAAKKKARPRG